MPDVTLLPATGSLLSAPYQLRARVQGVDFLETNKLFVVTLPGPVTAYSWDDGVITVDPQYTQVTEQGADYLDVTLERVSDPVSGSTALITAAYSDDGTPLTSVTQNYCFGNVEFLARSPVPDEVGVQVQAPLVFAVRIGAGLSYMGSALFLNEEAVTEANGTFRRPNYTGTITIAGDVVTLKSFSRRAYAEGEPVALRWDLRVSPDFEESFVTSLNWTFYTVRRVPPLATPTLQRTELDRPSPTGVIEIFRLAALDALVPQGSFAAPAVVFFQAVQQSSLASLASTLPSAAVLAPETGKLGARDIASPVDAAFKLEAASLFWRSLLQVLVRDGRVSRATAELLDRAWNSGYPADRGGAVAAALLYAVMPSI
jgi:hypothetical protein